MSSSIPVQTTGANPQCSVDLMIDTSASYHEYKLTTNNFWQISGANTTAPIRIAEGFWISKPTNATWSLSRTIL